MSFKQWIYHETKQPKIIQSDDFEDHEALGWADSPARFLKLESVGIDKKKVDAGDEQELEKAQQALDAVEGVVASLNGALNLESFNKDELEIYARDHFSLELDKRRSKKRLIEEIKTLIEG